MKSLQKDITLAVIGIELTSLCARRDRALSFTMSNTLQVEAELLQAQITALTELRDKILG